MPKRKRFVQTFFTRHCLFHQAMTETEERLIRRAQQGNLAAFEQLVALHDRQVLKLAFHLLSRREDAEDVYQEIFVLVFRKIGTFRFESEFSTWLYRIVVNACINYRKKRSRERFYSLESPLAEDEESEGRYQIAAPEVDPERAAMNRELGQKISEAIASLSEQQRAVFVLRHFHGHKLQDIAAILSCAEGTVKNYLFRATQHLQQKLRAYHEGSL
ncbi:RNA polymerase subunit sigma-24 [candidate division KSB1 bacterium]|nr:MAG: RNA polymerase subunit sigma-24 [candidate division KSB1 bacterium]